MTKSSSPTAYPDVSKLLDYALAHPGTKVKFNSSGRAMHFKQRCNSYRVLLRKMEAERLFGIPGARPEISYDILIIRQIDTAGRSTPSGTYLLFDHAETEGTILLSDGTEKPIADL